MSEELSNDITIEFDQQIENAERKKDSIQLFQDKIRTHISTLETIISNLENLANNCSDPNKKASFQKAISFSFDRLVRFYELYDKYESTSHKYHSSNIDAINKKHTLIINYSKNLQSQETSHDFFRKLNSFLSQAGQEELSDIVNQQPEEEMYKL